MIGFTARVLAPPAAMSLLTRVREELDTLPTELELELDEGDSHDWVCCHAVARVLAARVAGLSVADGKFGAHAAHWHSWLALDAHPGWIIDPYPIAAVCGPILLDLQGASPWKVLYRLADLRPTELARTARQVEALRRGVR